MCMEITGSPHHFEPYVALLFDVARRQIISSHPCIGHHWYCTWTAAVLIGYDNGLVDHDVVVDYHLRWCVVLA